MHPAISQPKIDSLSEPGRVVALDGGNFSGRTRLLRLATGLAADPGDDAPPLNPGDRPRAYIAPDAEGALSTIAQTVEQEIRFQARSQHLDGPLRELLGWLGLDRLHDRRPTTLSGGELISLSVVAGLALRPETLAIDCGMEQLDADRKACILEALAGPMASETSSLLADNRLSEWDHGLHRVPVQADYPPPFTIDPDVAIPPPPGAAARLALRRVGFAYRPDSPILRDVSLDLEPGVLYHLVGRNGAGKSTLAKILCGVIRVQQGRLERDGKSFDPWSHPGREVSYHFQRPDMQFFATSVGRELAVRPRSSWWAGGAADTADAARHAERAAAILTAFGLDKVRNEHPQDLPFVLRKRAALAATLAAGKWWVILDEPTLGQDDVTVAALVRIVGRLLDQGVGIVIITHSTSFRAMLPGRILRLETGTTHVD